MTQHILITGASSGIGFTSAIAMAQRGYQVFAGYRRPEDGQRLDTLHENITAIKLDITQAADIEQAVAAIEKVVSTSNRLIIFNNAGIAVASPLEFLPLNEFEEQLNINVTAQLAVTQAFLPLLRQVKDGRIIFNSSVSGFISIPCVGAYAASKHALEAMADALRRELAVTSAIKVSVLEPGSLNTPIWQRSLERVEQLLDNTGDDQKALYKKLITATRESAGEAKPSDNLILTPLIHACETANPKSRYLVGQNAWLFRLLSRFAPEAVVDFLIYRQYR